MLPGCHVADAVTAAALAEATGGATPNSRRVTATAAHSNGLATGEPPSPPSEPNHDNTFAPTPPAEPADAACGSALITGTSEADENTRPPTSDDSVTATGSATTEEPSTRLLTRGLTTVAATPTLTPAGSTTSGRAPRLFARAAPAPRTGEEPDAAPRAPRGPALAGAEESEAAAPAAPADPVVSADATGIDAITEPTPKATANAPTRPITPPVERLHRP